MQAEQMDNMDELIREASKSHHPAYDDKSWEKMEALLDKHLPVKKDRRRPLIFFLLCLLITSGAFFIILHLSTNKIQIITESKLPGIPVQQKSLKLRDNSHLTTTPPVTNDTGADPFPGNGTSNALQNTSKLLLVKHLKIGSNPFSGSSDLLAGVSPVIDPVAVNDQGLTTMRVINDNSDIARSYHPGLNDQQPVNPGSQSPGKDSITAKAADVTITGTAKTAVVTSQPTKSPGNRKQAVKKGFANNFAVNLSAGPDLSFVGLANQSKGRLSYGAGLGYTFAGRFTVKTGFFVTKKTYSAKGNDYHPPSWYWTYNAFLDKVYADCDIYEIPLSVSYNFKQTNGHNWFAGIGLSTFLMKKETYDYYYKDAWGQAMNKSWTLRNGGNQYFSVLTLSAGYQYRINPRVSISAEPYFKLPLQGIGFGKIKLNSGGVLFTASIKPFAPAK